MYRKPYLERLPRILKLGKQELSQKIRDLTGFTEREAENSIEAVTLAIGVWLEDMVQNIPENAKAELLISKFGMFQVSFGVNYKPGSGNRTRRRLGLPPVSKMEVNFKPSIDLAAQISKINRQAKKESDYISECNYQQGVNSQHHDKFLN